MGVKQERAKSAAIAAFEKAQAALADHNAATSRKYGLCEPASAYRKRLALEMARDKRLMAARRWGALHNIPFCR